MHAHDHSTYMVFALAGAEGTDSPLHVDASGFGTVVTVQEGKKLWTVAQYDFTTQEVFKLLDHWSEEEEDRIAPELSDAALMQRGDFMCVNCLLINTAY